VNTPISVQDADSLLLEFDDNSLLPLLFGSHNAHLAQIEQRLDVSLNSRGNEVVISGAKEQAATAATVLNDLYQLLKDGRPVDPAEIDGAIRMISGGARDDLKAEDVAVHTRKKHIQPRTPLQANYLRAIDKDNLVFGLGPAGTGKTYLAVAMAVTELIQGKVDRLILSRPAVEAGERLGFLPGDLQEKIDPYLRPLYDALHDMLPEEQIVKRLSSGEIEVAPLAFMRGRTLSRAFIILDEAQNTSAMQMKMFLTRLGEGSRMAVTGDMSQIDLPSGTRSGLADALDVLDGVGGVRTVRFGESDVVRHAMVARIVTAYNARDKLRSSGNGDDIGDADRNR